MITIPVLVSLHFGPQKGEYPNIEIYLLTYEENKDEEVSDVDIYWHKELCKQIALDVDAILRTKVKDDVLAMWELHINSRAKEDYHIYAENWAESLYGWASELEKFFATKCRQSVILDIKVGCSVQPQTPGIQVSDLH